MTIVYFVSTTNIDLSFSKRQREGTLGKNKKREREREKYNSCGSRMTKETSMCDMLEIYINSLTSRQTF